MQKLNFIKGETPLLNQAFDLICHCPEKQPENLLDNLATGIGAPSKTIIDKLQRPSKLVNLRNLIIFILAL